MRGRFEVGRMVAWANGAAGEKPKQDGVVDADFEVVDEKDKEKK